VIYQFYNWLITYKSDRPCGDCVSDLAAEVRRDERAPHQTARLLDYLLHRKGVDTDVLNTAVDLWRKSEAKKSS
jgi:uncharacterized protein YozE (UPF0346 family)